MTVEPLRLKSSQTRLFQRVLFSESASVTAETPQKTTKGQATCLPGSPGSNPSRKRKKYFLHLLSAEALKQRGMASKTARLVINAYPVFVLSNEWLEELYCEQCGSSHWCHIIKHSPDQYTVRWAPQHLWEQVAHVDPSVANPTVSEYTRKQARRHQQKRVDGKRFYG